MNVAQQKQQKGFTIIEVILVLAIAGLIFLMVFLALPALQRGQRNTQRKNDLGRVLSAVQNFQSNNQGALPAAAVLNTTFKTQYLTASGDKFTDPSTGNVYTFVASSAPVSPAVPAVGTIYYTVGAICDGTQASGVKTGQGSNKVAVQTSLEGSGVGCDNN